MSWPDDGGPRYVVQTVTGYLIGTASGSAGRPPSCAAVLDRAYCDRVVVEFLPSGGFLGISSAECIALAKVAAAELNERDGQR